MWHLDVNRPGTIPLACYSGKFLFFISIYCPTCTLTSITWLAHLLSVCVWRCLPVFSVNKVHNHPVQCSFSRSIVQNCETYPISSGTKIPCQNVKRTISGRSGVWHLSVGHICQALYRLSGSQLGCKSTSLSVSGKELDVECVVTLLSVKGQLHVAVLVL